jgi:hypothetical protein
MSAPLLALPRPAQLLGLVLLTGCGLDQMAQEWQLDRLRVLAARATPAEPRPGEAVRFESLVYTPPDETLGGVVWFACLPASATDFGCELDTSALDDLTSLDPATASAEELSAALEAAQDAGFVGFEPAFPPVWQTPTDALDGLDELARLEGVTATLNITALPDESSGSLDDVDEVELAFKRLPISEAPTPNHNPDVVAIEVDGSSTADGLGTAAAPIVVQGGKPVDLEVVLADDAVETYSYTPSTGVAEDREEEPYFAWYTEGGEFEQTFSLYPNTTAAYTPPKQSGWTGIVVVVVRDRRGGMGWHTVHLSVE